MGARETLVDFFEDIAASTAPFLVYDDGFRTHSYSYRDVAIAARGFAHRLQAAGLVKGDRIVIWSENRPEWLAALWGAMLAGIIVVPVDYRASPDLLDRIVRASSARIMLTGAEVPRHAPVAAWPLDDFDWKPAASGVVAPIAKGDLAEILFTSGATAEPKGVTITHRNILANIVPVEREVSRYKKYAGPFRPIRFLNLLPLSHLFGQSMAAFIPPMIEGVVVFMHGYSPVEIASQIRRRRVSVLVSVPKILDVLREYVLQVVPEAAAPPRGPHWLSRWWQYRRVHRLFGWKFWSFIAGAAPLDPDLESFWKKLGYVVIQGYGLTETAPIVTLNHPFHTRQGSVGKPIAGVEVKVAPDGEILVRGENVTGGYYDAPAENAAAFADGWFHTGDIGRLDEEGRLTILGRKKEMIVTAEGLNVFPDDVERVLRGIPGVRDAAVVGMGSAGSERVHAALILDEGMTPEDVIRQANPRLEDHQKVRSATVWPDAGFPRTEGTRKLKRRLIRDAVESGVRTDTRDSGGDPLQELLSRYSRMGFSEGTNLEEFGLSSLERVELVTAIEHRLGAAIDDAELARIQTVADLRRAVEAAPRQLPAAQEWEFPRWNRSWWARAVRRLNLPLWVLPLGRIFAHVRSFGVENLHGVEPPVIFAANHQSHFDVPSILMALPPKWRYRLSPAMSKEFFDAHFHPERHSTFAWFTNSLNYYLGCLMFQAFPIPQRETGARGALRYAGEVASSGGCVLIFPEGKITDTGAIARFQPGVGMLASLLQVPVVPVRLVGLTRVLHRTWKFPRPGRVEVHFGPPLQFTGEDYAAYALAVANAVRDLSAHEY